MSTVATFVESGWRTLAQGLSGLFQELFQANPARGYNDGGLAETRR